MTQTLLSSSSLLMAQMTRRHGSESLATIVRGSHCGSRVKVKILCIVPIQCVSRVHYPKIKHS